MALPFRNADVETYVTPEGDGAILQVPAAAFRARGIRIAVALPLCWYLVAAYVAFAAEGGAGVAFGVATVAAIASAGWGAWVMSGAEAASAATRVSMAADGTFTLGSGRAVPSSSVKSLRVTQGATVAKLAVVADTDAGPVEVLSNIPPNHGVQAKAVANWVAAALGVEADTRAAPNALGWSSNSWAAACYFPVQGVWLVASLASLAAATDPLVRFSAKQSLAFYVGTGAVLVGVLVATLAGSISADNEAILVAGMVIVIGLSIGRLGVGLYAAWQAYQGRAWPMPGLGWLGPPPKIEMVREPGDPTAGAWQSPTDS